ncbi:MAG: hypothetical protein V3V99_08090 [candidate division Zixibacteria bacterium]
MTKYPGGIFIIWLILISRIWGNDLRDPSGLSFSSGLEYQLISQEYYSSIIDTTHIDLLENWTLTQEKFDEVIFKTNLRYRRKSPSNRFNLITDIELSRKRWISRAESFYQMGNMNKGLRLYAKFENKSSFEDDSYYDRGYRFIQTNLRGICPITSHISIGIRPKFEYVSFEKLNSGTEFLVDQSGIVNAFQNKDYSISGAELLGEIKLSEFSRVIDWSVTFNHRDVPDSSLAAYNQYSFRIGFSNFGYRGSFILESNLELKDYAQFNNREDFTAFELSALANRNLGEKYEIGLILQFSNYSYKSPDIVYRNHYRIRPEVRLIRKIGNWSIGPELVFERYVEGLTEEYNSIPGLDNEDYSHWEAGILANFMNLNSVFLNSGISLGRRYYPEDLLVLSSYSLISGSMIADISITKNISINLNADINFERHKIKEDNMTLYLLSASVKSRF